MTTRTPEAVAYDNAQSALIAAGISLAIVVEGEGSTDVVTRHSLEMHARAYRAYLDSITALTESFAIERATEASIVAVRDEVARFAAVPE